MTLKSKFLNTMTPFTVMSTNNNYVYSLDANCLAQFFDFDLNFQKSARQK